MALRNRGLRSRGIPYAAASAVFLGLSPIFGKQAILGGMSAIGVVAARTAGAAVLLFLVVLIFRRRHLYIYPLGFVGCVIAGILNGIGSLFYYSGLARLDAGLAQLIYSLYPVLVAGLLYLDGQRHSRLTFFRLGISFLAVFLLTSASAIQTDPRGVTLMLVAALLYAVHIPINQRVLYEAPAPTVTLYTLLAMTAVVTPAYFFLSPDLAIFPAAAIWPLLGITTVTFLSRLALFAGVKSIGGMQTSILGLGELLVVVSLAHVWLGESLTPIQWLGAGLLAISLLLVGREPHETDTARLQGWLHWLLPPISTTQTVPAEQPEPQHDQ